MEENRVLAIGRWMPIHLGHKKFLVDLAKKYDKLVIGIGSCYENGTPRNCIPAVEREKLLRKIMKTEGIDESKFEIAQIPDRETFEEWIDDVSEICKKYNVTHFCTGNKEDILNVLKEKNIDLNLTMIDPEETSNFPYHATDVRNAILKKDIDFLKKTLPKEIIKEVVTNVGKEIVAANKGEGQKFIPGRQTVDMVFSVRNEKDGKIYTLIGKRNKDKIDFPGYNAIPGGAIDKFESPVNAISRVFLDETGLDISIIDNSVEPAKVKINDVSDKIEEMHFVGIYASPDEKINGSRGGGSQCFSILIDGNIDKIKENLFSEQDLEDLRFVNIEELSKMKLAFEQKTMVFDAFQKLGIDYDKEEKLDVLDENGEKTGETVSRKDAHEKGILHGASHTYIYRKNGEKIEMLLQRRSHNKDSFPDCLDISSAGHMEAGLSFEETAIKELEEELGLKIEKGELTGAFKQRFSNITEHNGKKFNNQEINEIYFLRRDDLDISKVELQEEEVSEVVWMDTEEITKRLEQEDKELCLDKEEYLKVLDRIREREKMEENKVKLKSIYADAILQGHIEGAKFIKETGVRKRKDGVTELTVRNISSQTADRLVEKKSGDMKVAYAIASILYSSTILYGKTGIEFLKNKLEKEGENFSQNEFSEEIARNVMQTYRGERKEAVINGISDALNDKENIEANAAKAAIMMNEYRFESLYDEEDEIQEDYINGKIIKSEDMFKEMEKAKFGEINKEEAIRNLNIIYDYLEGKGLEKIAPNFKNNFKEISPKKLLVYFISQLSEEEVERIKMLSDRKKTKE